MLLRAIPLAMLVAGVAFWTPASRALNEVTPDAVTVDGGRYYGPLVNGRLHGLGRVEWDDGTRYEGHFANGVISGKGRRQDSAGRLLDGEFKAGMLHGKGRLETPEGELYEGDFLDGRFHGEGRYRDPTGTVQEGTFYHGVFTGRGRMHSQEGWRYEGEVKDGRPHGRGVLHLANGDVFEGGFADGLYEGEGTLTYAVSAADGHGQDRGVWRAGVLDDPGRKLQSQQNAEAALYHQRALLDAALQSLEPRRADSINLYLLAIGGDGRQEVFRREVDFVAEQFTRHFGAKGHALSLVNSRNTVKTRPMATLTSIRASLNAIAARMDRERDVLFLFITSHGSREHQIALDQDAIQLPDLQAEELGRMVRETDIRWKVVVVSACYGGGVIDALKDDHTLIITAARYDRRSFGCADDYEFTYFGRAFFKEALPVSQSFEDAFLRAEKLVKEWELALLEAKGKSTSEGLSLPQMINPAPIQSYLRQWWAQVKPDRRTVGSLKQ